MRLSRRSLLARLGGPDAPTFTAIEAPTGFGKSWLLRKAAPPGALRLRGELGPVADPDYGGDAVVIIDDAHLLSPDDVERLIEFVEDATPPTRVIVAGRVLADPIHDVAHLVDGVVLDASALAITPDELLEECPDLSDSDACQLIDTAEGCVRVIVGAIGQSRLEPNVDVTAIATRILRSMGAASLQLLDARDAGLVSLLARAPGVDSGLLGRLGGPGFLDRVIAAGVLARRQAAGGIDLVAAAAFPTTAVDPSLASRLAAALLERGRHIEAVGLLIDAGAHERAARTVIELPESATRSVDARTRLGVLARLGTATEREPALLLLRAAASAQIGRVDLTGVDIERAVELSESVDPPMRRRIAVESAEWLLVQGRREEAVARVLSTISDLGPGEERTYARAHVVLADAASTSSNRGELQRAAEWYRIAAVAWEGCGEPAKARMCRCDLASQALEPLGRFDEALAQFTTLLASPDLGDGERAWLLLQEGFVLLSANRVDSAGERFARVADLGYIQDNPRTIAASAWARAMVAARREDVNEAVRLIAVAENTALGVDDDLNGIPFHCDAATALGAVGELELAERHLAAAQQRSPGYPDKVRLTRFILEARRGVRNDVAKQLAVTPPVEAWRVLLVSALAAAREGSVAEAQRLLLDAERELINLGFSDFRAMGERRAHEELRALLRNAPAGFAEPAGMGSRPVRVERREVAGPTVRVVGGPIAVVDGRTTIELPAGNPQRLVGVVVAHGGLATFDQVSDAIWPGDDVEASRVRLRNVLLRLRRAAGDIVVRTAAGVKLAPEVTCDLFEFERLAEDAMAAARADPDLAGHLAQEAVELVDGPIFGEFEYEEWAIAARRAAEHRLIGLLDLLSVRAEDAGDLPRAQSLAERALRLDRYADSRYVRLAEILVNQGRAAAAVAVLADASEVAKELGGAVPAGVKRRRDDIIRRSAAG